MASVPGKIGGMVEAVAPPMGKSLDITHAPVAEEHESKRTQGVYESETHMVGAMQELRIQTVERNAVFQQAMDAMEQRTKKAWSRLDQEVAERNADFDHIRDAFSGALEAMESMVEGSSQRAFDSIEKSRLRLAHARCEQITAAEEQAYQHDVPELVTKLIGPARKQMQKAHESFDVENAKVLAREQRLVAGMDDFEAKTQARLGMEEQDRALQVATVAEQLSGQLLFPVRVDRCHQRARIMPAVRGVQESLAAEQAARTAGDAFARSSMAAASERLQAVVLDNFGGESDASGTDAGSEASESDSD